MSSYWNKLLAERATRRTALATTGSAILAASWLVACGGGGSKSEKPAAGPKDVSGLVSPSVDTTSKAKRGGVLKRNTTNEGSLDPNLSVSGVSAFHELANARLVTLEEGHFNIPTGDVVAPDLAESWEYSPDRLQITMKLRQGVKFHNLPPVNGRIMDVDDVLFSWKRFTTNSAARGAVANSANPDAPVLSVTSTDARTIVIKLKEPISYVLTYFAGRELINMMPKEFADPSVLDLRGTMLGAGPYYLSKREPSVGFTFKRHDDFWDKKASIDQIDYPIIPEYAAGLAQLRAGNLHLFAVRPEDVLQTKKDLPSLNLYVGDVGSATGQNLIFGRRTPALRDVRVRLAFQMSYDRDTWVDTLENAQRYESAGLPVERTWFSAFPGLGHSLDSWRLEPRDAKAFGANAKYYQHDVAEAKKLLTAAGFPNGFEIPSTSPVNGAGSGITTIDARQSMNGEIGIKFKNNVIPYEAEFIPKYRDGLADFEGVAYKAGVQISNDPIDRMCQAYWSKGGVQFYGFDVDGKGDASGDPYVDQTLVKGRIETDAEKRKALFKDLQRYLAAKAYGIHGLGGATTFSLAWPVIANYQVWNGAPGGGSGTNVRVPSMRWWIDDSQPPLKKS